MINPSIILFLIDMFNSGMDKLIPAICGIAFIIAIFSYTHKRIKKDGLGKGLYLWCITLIPILIWLGIFWFGQTMFTWLTGWNLDVPLWVARWIMIWVTLCPVAYFMTKEYGEKRGLKSMFFHLEAIFLGWLFGKWFGIFIISLPVLIVYYNSMYRLADGIIPASNPEDKKERRQRFWLFFWYTWGLQYPIQVAHDNNATKRDADTRINGTPFNSFSAPGLIWLKSHQAAALTSGINFSRVEGPRAIFTKPYERLLEVVDLRTLKRTASIDTVSKDGVRYKAIVFASFALDREKWSPETYSQLYRQNPTLAHAMKLDANQDGVYSFSRPRIQAALKTRGKTSTIPEQQKPIFWDERVFNQVEVATSHVLSERKFDELWHPINDGPGVSALDEIADQIKERLVLDLLSQGVRLFAARVVAFDFSEYKDKETELKESESKDSDHKKPEKNYDSVIKQQIKSWRVDWESQRLQIIVDADAEANHVQQAARAHVQSVLLTAIAEGLQQTRVRYPNLPRHVIAMHFVGALEQLIHHEQEPEGDSEETASSLIKSRARWPIDRRDR